MNRFILCVLSTLLIVPLVNAQERAFVQVRESKVRSQPKIWASPVASLSYGDELTKLDEEGGWSKVKTSAGRSGYTPTSSLTSKVVVLSSSRKVESYMVDPTDAILAGKGFDKEVERLFASQSSGNFSAVDQIERISIADSELRSFVVNGSLKGGQ